MTDQSTTETADSEIPTAEDDEPSIDQTDADEDQRQQILRYAQWVAFGILALVALIATLQFYLSASQVIQTFVTPRYRPLFSAGFNLVILLASGIGISLLVRRLA